MADMILTNHTNNDYWFGPLHMLAGDGQTLTVDTTTELSLYLTNDAVADAINNVVASGFVTATSAPDPFPRPTGTPQLLHGDGSPEGIVYAPQGSLYMRRDNTGATSSIYAKTSGVTLNTGWQAVGAETDVAPTGVIHQYGGPTAPTGWMLCDGNAVSRTTYDALFAIIGTSYGGGDGSTTYNLPDLRGRVPVGYAASGGHVDVSSLGSNEGLATSLNHRRPKHQHTPHSHTVPLTNGPNVGANGAQQQYASTHTADLATTGIDGGSGNGNDPTDAPAYLVVNHIIKT
jgi:microcystin-dependent protein